MERPIPNSRAWLLEHAYKRLSEVYAMKAIIDGVAEKIINGWDFTKDPKVQNDRLVVCIQKRDIANAEIKRITEEIDELEEGDIDVMSDVWHLKVY